MEIWSTQTSQTVGRRRGGTQGICHKIVIDMKLTAPDDDSCSCKFGTLFGGPARRLVFILRRSREWSRLRWYVVAMAAYRCDSSRAGGCADMTWESTTAAAKPDRDRSPHRPPFVEFNHHSWPTGTARTSRLSSSGSRQLRPRSSWGLCRACRHAAGGQRIVRAFFAEMAKSEQPSPIAMH